MFSRPPQAPEVSIDELADALEGGAFALDVRMADEYLEVHVPGAVLVPLPELGGRTDEVPRDQRVYVVCAGGGRSLAAAEALNNAGWDTVSVAGGTKAWVAAGRPTISGPDPGAFE